ncbi:MAG: hypothetical protein JNL42_00090 [Anaerolineae bacterium]|nr:hypothetical protein [Anaerolineae bacterium]
MKNRQPARLLPLLLIALFALTSACTSGASSVLNTTPAPGVIITEDEVITPTFIIDYPAGWRVITSAAGQPISITLVAPGDCELIIASTVNLNAPPFSPSCNRKDVKRETHLARLDNGVQIVLAGVARESEYEAFLPVWERVIASVEDPLLRDLPDVTEAASSGG